MTDFFMLVLFLYRYKYFLETSLLLLVLSMLFPKRRFAWLSMLAALVVGIGVSAYWSRELSAMLPLRLLRYFLLTGILWVGTLAALDITSQMALFATMTAVALQHISVRLHDMLALLFGMEQYSAASIITSLLSLFLIVALTYLLFVRRFRKEELDRISNRWMLFAGSGIVVIVLVLSQLSQADFPPAAKLMGYVYDTIGCVFGLGLLYAVVRTGRLESEVVTLQELIEQAERQRALRSENMELVNIKCHDIKKQLSSLGGRIEKSELESLENLVEIYDSGYQTGNRTLDVILAEKSLYCGEHGIRLTCMAEGAHLAFLSVSDIYSIFGNAIDNAVAAAENLPPEQRVISMTVRENLGMVSAHVENYYAGEIGFADGLPQTTQDDHAYHGFGTRSIVYTAKKYGGACSFKAENGVFTLDLLLPIPA